jgi:Tol biopolymer transport system component
MRQRFNWSLAVAFCVVSACDGPEAPEGGAVSVTAVNSGPAVLSAALGVSVGGVIYTGLSGTAPLVIAPLPAGDHQLELMGLPVHCAVEGEQLRKVNVIQGDTAGVEFVVRCEQAAGTVLVTASSEGQEIDPNGYRVVVDGTLQGDISIAGALSLAVPPGPHILELGHLTANCSAAQNPRDIMVPSGGSLSTAHFAVSCQVAPPAGRGHEIAFFSDRNGTGSQRGDQIFLMNEDGTGVRPLPNTGGPLGYFSPAWSPDGGRLVLVGADHLFLLDLSGGVPTSIPNTQGGNEPAWSPDGVRIAFVGNPDDDAQIWVVNVDGANARPVTSEGRDMRPSSPTWSPDGNRIAFVSLEAFPDEFTIARIVIRDLRNTSRVIAFTLENEFIGDVAWSPDGTKLAFSARSPGTFDTQIQVLDLTAGAEPRPVSSGHDDISPDWSPDGSRIAFTRLSFENTDIYTVNLDGTEELKITTDSSVDGDPAWRPL